MNEQDYVIAWSIYAGAALGLIVVFWLMTGWMWRYLREPLRVLLFVLLFTPTPVDAPNNFYAPAIAITALDLVFKTGNNAWKAASDLVLMLIIAMGCYLAFVIVRAVVVHLFGGRRTVQSSNEPDEEYDDDLMEISAKDMGRIEPRL